MINRFMSWVGNLATIGAASIASINMEDFRLWFVAIAGVGATLWASWRKTRCEIASEKAEKYKAMREKITLCKTCKESGIIPASCVVEAQHRDKDCPLN